MLGKQLSNPLDIVLGHVLDSISASRSTNGKCHAFIPRAPCNGQVPQLELLESVGILPVAGNVNSWSVRDVNSSCQLSNRPASPVHLFSRTEI